MMREHIEAVRTMLTTAGLSVHLTEVQGSPSYPYVLLWSGTGLLVADSLSEKQNLLDDTIGVTSVGLTAESVLAISGRARAALMNRAPVVSGYHVSELRLVDAQRVTVDTDFTAPGTNTHPLYGVDLFSIRSYPA